MFILVDEILGQIVAQLLGEGLLALMRAIGRGLSLLVMSLRWLGVWLGPALPVLGWGVMLLACIGLDAFMLVVAMRARSWTGLVCLAVAWTVFCCVPGFCWLRSLQKWWRA